LIGGFTPIFDGFLVSSKYLELCLENVFYMIHIKSGYYVYFFLCSLLHF
jgi:hypothetical protein